MQRRNSSTIYMSSAEDFVNDVEGAKTNRYPCAFQSYFDDYFKPVYRFALESGPGDRTLEKFAKKREVGTGGPWLNIRYPVLMLSVKSTEGGKAQDVVNTYKLFFS